MPPTTNETIVIDRDGDVLLTLNNPNAPFAVWDPSNDHHGSDGTLPAANHDNSDEKSSAQREEKAMPIDTTAEKLLEREKSCVASDSSNVSDDQPHESTNIASRVYKVSSRHLISASSKFRKELTGPWNESIRGENAMYHLATCDWDPEAFEILLNVYHLRYRQVPKKMGLETLAKMAVLVDYYRCWEAFDLIAPLWVEEARRISPVSDTYERNTILWMMISWVFKLNEDFTQTTAIAITQNTEMNIHDMELGIPPAILDALRTRRSDAIGQVISKCHNLLDQWSGEYKCHQGALYGFFCSSTLLGSLMKGLKRLKLLSPVPLAPFTGWSLLKICDEVKSLPCASLRDGHHKSQRCDFSTYLHPQVDSVLARTTGLALGSFKDEGEEVAE